MGKVVELSRVGDAYAITIEAGLAGDLGEGDSVAVNGVCLTAVGPDRKGFKADLTPETIQRSSLGALSPGDVVNLELPLRPTDRLGGHIVQGHVDGVGRVTSITEHARGRDIRFDATPELLRYVVEKGSIAVDGVSLTVSAVDEAGFSVALIPETLARTTLGRAEEGSPVNLEVDVIAKHVEKLVTRT